MISISQLKAIMPHATDANLKAYVEPLNRTLERFDINTPLRISAFIAQLAHESGSFRYVKELAPGKAYEGRRDLGNTSLGDGMKYKGRGLIQITGRKNYTDLGKALGIDLINHPELLEGPEFAAMSAGWFWSTRGLNLLADQEKFGAITKRINGGTNGEAERNMFYLRAKKALL